MDGTEKNVGPGIGSAFKHKSTVVPKDVPGEHRTRHHGTVKSQALKASSLERTPQTIFPTLLDNHGLGLPRATLAIVAPFIPINHNSIPPSNPTS